MDEVCEEVNKHFWMQFKQVLYNDRDFFSSVATVIYLQLALNVLQFIYELWRGRYFLYCLFLVAT